MTGKLNVLVLSVFALVFFTIPLYAADDTAASLKKVTLAPQWFPQAQFAGYYMAKEMGLYRKYGLDVNFLYKPPQRPILSVLQDHTADFVTDFLSSGIKLRERGVKIVNICQISQRSALVFVAKKKSGINKIEDINGRRLGLWMVDFREIPLAMLNKYSIKAEIVPIVSGIDLFLWDGIDVLTVMSYNEYHQLIAAGINEDELTTFFFNDYNLDIPEDGIYCLQETFEKDPDMCQNFVLATIEGWKLAFSDKKKALEIVNKYCREQHIPFNLAHQKWMLDKMEELIIVPDRYTGFLSAKVYQETTKKMRSAGIINTIPAYNDFYKYLIKGNNEYSKEQNVQE